MTDTTDTLDGAELPTMKLPILAQMSEAAYREHQADGALGGSGLATIYGRSYAHYLADRERMKTKAAASLGRMIHTYVLEGPAAFAEQYMVAPEIVDAGATAAEPRKVERPDVAKVERPEVWQDNADRWRVDDQAEAEDDARPGDIEDDWYMTRADAEKVAQLRGGWWEVDHDDLRGSKYDTKKEATAAAKTVSGWTLDGETFHSTKKELLASIDDSKTGRWMVEVDGEATRHRTRADAERHIGEAAGFREVIKPRDWQTIEAVAGALAAHPVASVLLAQGHDEDRTSYELSCLWRDDERDITCTARFDRLLHSGILDDDHRRVVRAALGAADLRDQWSLGIDLKTTGKAAHPRRADRLVHEGGMHVQAAHYAEGYRAATGDKLDAWVDIIVETSAPYGITVVILDDDYMALGAYARAQAIEIYKAGEAAVAEGGAPPAYDTAPVVATPPAWAVPDELAEAPLAEWAAASERRRQLAEARERREQVLTDIRLTEQLLADARAGVDRHTDAAVAAARELKDYAKANEHAAEADDLRRQVAGHLQALTRLSEELDQLDSEIEALSAADNGGQ